MSDRTLILFPGALGDFLCCWAGVRALPSYAEGKLTLVAREELFDLFEPDEVTALSIDRREVADLFATGPLAAGTRTLFSGYGQAHSWTGHGNPSFAERLAAATQGVVSVYPFRGTVSPVSARDSAVTGMRPGEHAATYFARCLGVTPSEKRLPPRPQADIWASDFWCRHRLGQRTLAIHAGSGSKKKNWEGMAGVAAQWQRMGGQVIAIAGAAEEDSGAAVRHDAIVRNQTLARVAAVLHRVYRYLGNDSGISHLAGAVGCHGVAVFGPTDAVTWRPLSDTIRVIRAPEPCAECDPDRFCTHRLQVETVLAALCR